VHLLRFEVVREVFHGVSDTSLLKNYMQNG
jgi:hypothetical protein